MKKLFPLLFAVLLAACSSMIPYKNQNLDYLHGIEQNPDAYRGKIVSFGGEVKGVTEDTRQMRLIIKIDVPFYYYATGKDPLSYELLLISFDKKGMPQMTGIQKGHDVKVLARVANYETRKNLTGKPIAVLHLIAFALADRTRDKDFFRPEPPHKQLYDSWKAGKLFFEEQPQEIEKSYPAPQRKTMRFIPPLSQTAEPIPAEKPKGIVYDEEEPAFLLPPDPQPAQENASKQNLQTATMETPSLETTPAKQADGMETQPQKEESGNNPEETSPVPAPEPEQITQTPAAAAAENAENAEPGAPLTLGNDAVDMSSETAPQSNTHK